MQEEKEENKIPITIQDFEPINPDFETEYTSDKDYDFLNIENKSINNDDIITSQFDNAFKKSSPVIQNYILNNKLEENIKLICKIEKLNEEKAQVIIENVTVSILVGLLQINEAKETLVESFRSSGIVLEPFTAGMIMKNIDAYILSDIRKQILEGKLEEKKEIRHLTLKEKKEAVAKEELRKILLERTGNLSGSGQPFLEYKNREVSKSQNTEIENRKNEVNRDSLLEKINLKNISTTSKMKERMVEIQKEEEKRLEEKNKDLSKTEIETSAQKPQPEESPNLSKALAETLKQKLDKKEGENIDLDKVRKQREIEEVKLQQKKSTPYTSAISKDFIGENSNGDIDESFDPYRETAE